MIISTVTLKDTGQDRSPAGLEAQLEYMPACNVEDEKPNQVTAMGNGMGQTAYEVTRGDGETIGLAILPTVARVEAFKTLDSWGLCKLGGIEAPLVKPGSVVATVGQRLEITPEMASTPSSPAWIWLPLVVLGVSGAIAFYLYRNRPDGEDDQW